MARYKPIDTSPRFIAVDLERQLLPGAFEHALNHLIDHELDLSGFDTRYKNDLTGASAKDSLAGKCSPLTASNCRAMPARPGARRFAYLERRFAGR